MSSCLNWSFFELKIKSSFDMDPNKAISLLFITQVTGLLREFQRFLTFLPESIIYHLTEVEVIGPDALQSFSIAGVTVLS